MWSGPRNLSTAMMRSFENRAEVCGVMDEPFYAVYLSQTGKDHPMREEVLASQPHDWREVVAACADAPVPEGRIVYQKHMTHHMLPVISREWLGRVTNVFLIRHPRRVLASYVRKLENVTLEDIGFVQQAELFDHVMRIEGEAPAVIEAEDIRADPEAVLRRLCDQIGIGFDPGMLSWPKGPRRDDGVWAAHWYASVEASAGFTAPEPEPAEMPPEVERVAEAAMPAYERLRQFKL